MSEIILIILKFLWIMALLFVPGGLTLLAARKSEGIRFIKGWIEFIFFSFLGSFALLSLLGLLTAQLGIFSLPLISGFLFAYSLLIVVIFQPDLDNIGSYLIPTDTFTRGPLEKATPVILLVILLLAGFLFFRPTNYIFGGWDPGVYINTAVNIEKTGKVFIDDPTPKFLSPEEWTAYSQRHSSGYLEKYPGFRRTGAEGNCLIPQFYHLFPAILAISYSFSGMAIIFYLTPLLGLISLLAIYLAVREMMDRKIALAAVFLIAINMAQIWHARFPVTEILSQALLFSGMFLLTRYLKRGESYTAGMAGTVFGLLILTRISALLLFLPLAIFFYCRWFISFQRKDLKLALPLLILTAYSLLSGIFFGGHYIKSAFENFRGGGSVWLYLSLLPIAAAIGVRMTPKKYREVLEKLFTGRGWRWTAVAIIILLVLFGYFIRPADPGLSADRTNLIELGWLVTLPGLILGLAGICLLILENRDSSGWFFLLLTISFALVFLCRQLIHPYYMWAARRFMVVVVPGFLICATWFMARLGRIRVPETRWVAVLLFLIVAGREVSDSRVLFSHREYRGSVQFFNHLAKVISGGDLIVVEGKSVDKLPTTLHLVYDFSVIPVYSPREESDTVISDLIRKLRKNTPPGERFPTVYLLTGQRPAAIPGVTVKFKDEINYHATLFERSGTHLPASLDDKAPDGTIKVKIFQLLPTKLSPPTAGII